MCTGMIWSIVLFSVCELEVSTNLNLKNER